MSILPMNESTTELHHGSGKECRGTLYLRRKRPVRLVPGFTYQALQPNTAVIPPPSIDIYKKRPKKTTLFSIYYRRGDIPAARMGIHINKKDIESFPVKWFCPTSKLDYCHYLPVFMDGLADCDPELRELAQYGAMDLIVKEPGKVLPTIPKCIMPLKRALHTRDKKVICTTLKVIQLLVFMVPCAGIALVPYYRKLLPMCNLYKHINVNYKCGIDNKRSTRVGDVIEDTLKLMERCGGPNAYINIKYMVPTYESNVQPIRPCPDEHPLNTISNKIVTQAETINGETYSKIAGTKPTQKQIQSQFSTWA